MAIFFTSWKVQSEYRAYQYLLSSNQAEKQNMTILTTSFNPRAMQAYYGISPSRLYLLRTWRCPGNTANKQMCSPPYTMENLNAVLNQVPGANQ